MLHSGQFLCLGAVVRLLASAVSLPLTQRQDYGLGDQMTSLSDLRQGLLQDAPSLQDTELDVDEMDDGSLRRLLLRELGSDHDDLLNTLFGPEPCPDHGARHRGSAGDLGPKYEKRAHEKPKFDPAWRFVGLGKRQSARKRGNYKAEGVPPVDEINPYLSILVLSNLSDFFQELKQELRSPPRDSSAVSGRRLQEGADMRSRPPSVQVPAGDAFSFLYTRARKPEGQWKFKPKTMYDPAWMLTGLGK